MEYVTVVTERWGEGPTTNPRQSPAGCLLTKKNQPRVVDFYARAGKLATVDGTGTVQEVRERIEEAISSLDIPAAVPFRGQ